MSDQPASDLIFQATYCYYLEVMTETFNRRTDNLMNFLLILTGGLTSVGVQFGWLCGILAVIFSAYRVAYKPADKAACADAQKSDIPDCLVISMRQVMLKSPDVWMNSKNSTVTLRPPSTTPQETELLSSFAATLNR